ncbi:hypothetical protein HMPREF9413_4066 [Paenibacillus sp. HGF7]|nr:hypothetical protein HMPREF9413_4066 [Paenibacillus sp. HGF7]
MEANSRRRRRANSIPRPVIAQESNYMIRVAAEGRTTDI